MSLRCRLRNIEVIGDIGGIPALGKLNQHFCLAWRKAVLTADMKDFALPEATSAKFKLSIGPTPYLLSQIFVEVECRITSFVENNLEKDDDEDADKTAQYEAPCTKEI